MQNENGKLKERIGIILRSAIYIFHLAMKSSQFLEGLNGHGFLSFRQKPESSLFNS